MHAVRKTARFSIQRTEVTSKKGGTVLQKLLISLSYYRCKINNCTRVWGVTSCSGSWTWRSWQLRTPQTFNKKNNHHFGMVKAWFSCFKWLQHMALQGVNMRANRWRDPMKWTCFVLDVLSISSGCSSISLKDWTYITYILIQHLLRNPLPHVPGMILSS